MLDTSGTNGIWCDCYNVRDVIKETLNYYSSQNVFNFNRVCIIINYNINI